MASSFTSAGAAGVSAGAGASFKFKISLLVTNNQNVTLSPAYSYCTIVTSLKYAFRVCMQIIRFSFIPAAYSYQQWIHIHQVIHSMRCITDPIRIKSHKGTGLTSLGRVTNTWNSDEIPWYLGQMLHMTDLWNITKSDLNLNGFSSATILKKKKRRKRKKEQVVTWRKQEIICKA